MRSTTLAANEVLKLVGPAEEAGADVIIVWCAGDPRLDAARTLVDVLVVGPGESMRLLIQLLGRNPAAIPAPIPVLDLRKDIEETKRLSLLQINELTKRGHDAFYLDCLGMFGMGRPLRAEASLEVAEAMVHLGLRYSLVAYPKYPPPHRHHLNNLK